MFGGSRNLRSLTLLFTTGSTIPCPKGQTGVFPNCTGINKPCLDLLTQLLINLVKNLINSSINQSIHSFFHSFIHLFINLFLHQFLFINPFILWEWPASNFCQRQQRSIISLKYPTRGQSELFKILFWRDDLFQKSFTAQRVINYSFINIKNSQKQ